MKKVLLIIILIFVIKTTSIAQISPNKMDTSDYKMDTTDQKWLKKQIEQSTLIIEGKVVMKKNGIYQQINELAGSIYTLYVIKPIITLKGNTDTTKLYQLINEEGEYSYAIRNDKIDTNSMSTSYAGVMNIPQYAVFFISEHPAAFNSRVKTISNGIPTYLDLYTIFPEAIYTDCKTNIDLTAYSREKIFKFLLEKFNLSATPLK